ncbi:hypothetical protein SAY87_031966 [Trapa incisa]|uniref:Protein kinase domain-containing protein n=1 Tax=Trapa incisa TaxID=236973 RepID=A0AAN7KU83_9MYRT|nr:hypothetical protein SAY87_031966 [Trapa incisa]
MDQFRQVGEVLGSMTALMVLQDEIPINKRQCLLLFEIFSSAFSLISTSIRQNLRLEDKNTTKWKALDQPLRELRRVFRGAEIYIKHCMDSRDWWAKVLILHQNKDCVEFHVHYLLCIYPAVVEAIETAGEISGLDTDEMQKRGVLLRRKYDQEFNDPKVFVLRFGEQYLATKELSKRFEIAWREDRWLLCEEIKGRRKMEPDNEDRLGELFLNKLNAPSDSTDAMLFSSSVFTGARDYQVRRRLGSVGQFKEIQWLGETFVMRHLVAVIEPLKPEIRTLLSLSHPNILQYLCGFCNEAEECFLILELMSKDLSSYIKEYTSPGKRNLFSLPVIIDIMLQIARGMEYLHSKGIFHGDLNPKNVLLKSSSSLEGYFHVKVLGFGLSSMDDKNSCSSPSHDATSSIIPFIWYAPEVLAEQAKQGSAGTSHCKAKYKEKADVYSFAMICFELLTGKVPFEDGHLQGDKMAQNIMAGERPLFSFSSPKFLVSLTKKCWATDPASRPSFSSICRILRYIKKFLVINQENDKQPELSLPSTDFCDIETGFQKKFLAAADTGSFNIASVWDIPFQMFSYKISEIGRTGRSPISSEPASGTDSFCRDENPLVVEENKLPLMSDTRSAYSDILGKWSGSSKGAALLAFKKNSGDCSRSRDVRSLCSDIPQKRAVSVRNVPTLTNRKGLAPGTEKAQDRRASRLNSLPRTLSMRKSIENLPSMVNHEEKKIRRKTTGHVSDSEVLH